MNTKARPGLIWAGIGLAFLLGSSEAWSQEGSGAVIQAITNVTAGGAASPGCGGGGGATLTGVLNALTGQSVVNEGSAPLPNRRAAFRFCDTQTTATGMGWSNDSSDAAGIASQSVAVAPDEVWAGMDNAQASFDIQTANLSRRLSLVRLSKRIDRNAEEQIARSRRPTALGVGSDDPLVDTGFNDRGFAAETQQDRGQRVMLALQEGINAGDGSMGDGLGFFINGRVNLVKGEESDAEGGSEGFGGGLTLGVDTALSEELFAGVAMGYTRISTNFDGNGSESVLNALTFSGYGALYPADNVYVDGSISTSYLRFDQTNDVFIADGGPDAADLEGETDGANFGLDIGTGYTIEIRDLVDSEAVGGLTVEPYARLNFLYTFIDAYDQEGGDGTLDLSIGDQETTSLTGTFGFRTEYPISTKHGVLTPYFRAAYVREFLDENDDLEVGLAVLQGASIKLKPQATDSNYGNFGVGVAATLGQGLSQFLDYDVVAGHDNVTIHQITAGMRFEF